MKIVINTNILIQNIQLALNTIDTKGLNPVLESILFAVNENLITLITSNNLCYSQINIKDGFKIESTGKFLVKGKMILDILNTLKSKELTLEIIDESVLRIYNNNFANHIRNYRHYTSFKWYELLGYSVADFIINNNNNNTTMDIFSFKAIIYF